MLSKILFGVAAPLCALAVVPAAAQAQPYDSDGYYDDAHYDGRYDDGYQDPRYDERYQDSRYDERYRDSRYANHGPRRYRPGDYYRGPYGRAGHYGRSAYYGRGHYRCGDGTTGAIVGGATGALIGRGIARDGRSYRYRRGGDGTVGAILGGAVGALIGREIDRGC